jgi:hypothetical protein
MQIRHLRNIRFEDCQFRTPHEPLSWAAHFSHRNDVTNSMGKSNNIETISHLSAQSIEMRNSQMARGQTLSVNLHVG